MTKAPDCHAGPCRSQGEEHGPATRRFSVEAHAAAAYRRDDWGTSLVILDFIYQAHQSEKVRDHVLATGATIAEQIYLLDDAFEAKLVALRLDPRVAHHIRSAARNAGHTFKRVGAT